jgi:hypothetical protein
MRSRRRSWVGIGERAVHIGLGEGREGGGAADAPVKHGQLVAHEAVGRGAAHQVRFGLALADRVGHQIAGLDMGEVAAVEIGDRQLTEEIVEDRGRHLDRVVALDDAKGSNQLKA